VDGDGGRPGEAGLAKVVMVRGEAGWQGTQQAGSGVAVLTHTGPGRAERIGTDPSLLQDPGAERANFRTAVCRVWHAVLWVCCEVALGQQHVHESAVEAC